MSSQCPIFDIEKNISVCPDCGKVLDGEQVNGCGNNCAHCGWSHCGQCS